MIFKSRAYYFNKTNQISRFMVIKSMKFCEIFNLAT